jgi:hypothetical protein
VRVLFLTCHFPYSPVSGGRRRAYELLTRLGDRAEVHLCAVTKTYEEDVMYAGALRRLCAGIRVAHDPEAFAAVIVDLLVRPAELPTWDEAAEALLDCYAELREVAQRPAASSRR